ncbi:MAG: hypothetical protein J7J98_06680, partial [candidate division Zixibacteria bacterium]|nr:hypothetical protein [candidate division Zixibacteria bacterium]
MMRRPLIALVVLSLVMMLAAVTNAAVGTRADRADASRSQNIEQFDQLGIHAPMTIFDDKDAYTSDPVSTTSSSVRRAVGSAVSPDNGAGIGESIALTWDDHQVYYPVGRHLSHYWNGETGTGLEVEVHFVYEMTDDTTASIHDGLPAKQTGYNVYVAQGAGNWPRGQDQGCVLQATDDIGTGSGANMVMRPNGLATIIADSRFFADQLGNGDYYQSNLLYYQGAQHNCVYDPRSGINTSFIDSSIFQPLWNDDSPGNHALYPAVATQIDGSSNEITHVLMAEMNSMEPSGTGYAEGADYRVFAHFRKVGAGNVGTWSAGTIIDTIERNFADMVVDPWSSRVVIAYSNPSYYGCLLNNPWDKDCYFRESQDYGVTWDDKTNITNYLNAVPGPHYSMYYEVKALYSSDGNLHILFQQTPASLDPYFDGYNWMDFNQDIAHWDEFSDAYVRVANGTYMNDDYLTGSINTIHCGFGGDPATYTQFFNISECDGKLYAVWNQIHPWANQGDYTIQPELLTDCAYTGERLTMANWEIIMSVAQVSSPTLWDPARHVTNTFTPNCGLPGDPDATGGVCGSEYKPYVEHYGLDEAGMSLTWPPETIVDLTPDGEGSYTGNYYLNCEYMDDQFPGAAWDLEGRDPNGVYSLNSMKWLRIACVEPVEASLIEVSPRSLEWPSWVELGQANIIPITVKNPGNVPLNVSDVALTDGGGGWLSASISPTSGAPFVVTAGVINTNTFDVTIDASGLSTTAWLDGEVVLTSDAADFPTVTIPIHVLAAVEVEPVVWDTVMTHENMFTEYFTPEGECVALAVGNNGDLGWGAGTSGSVNLDYVESETECGERDRDGYYLMGSTAFTILADASDGTNAKLTQSTNDAHQGDATGWDPIGTKGSIAGGLGTGGNGNDYDSVYTGAFVNRDTTIAMERTVYGPRSADPTNEIINFVVMNTKVYSADGAAHSHVTIGNVCDWDVPTDDVPDNTSGEGSSFVYIQGTDTVNSEACQPNVNRFATEAFGGGYTSAEWEANNCVNGSVYHGFNALGQLLMIDTNQMRDETPLVPSQPDPLAWWDETAVSGLNFDPNIESEGISDYAVWFTYVHDYDLGATDTLNFWTVLTTVRNGTLSDLEAQVSYAKVWYTETIRGCS